MSPPSLIASPLRHVDAAEVSVAAKAETRNREVHLPPVSAYRWWARRTESVNGAIIDAVAKDHSTGRRLLISDPFAGGGVIPLAAVMRNHRVVAQDLNPWAATGLAAMLGLPAAEDLRSAGGELAKLSASLIDRAYGTTMTDGAPAMLSHTFRVARSDCSRCGAAARHFPHALVSLLTRKERGDPAAFLACPGGHLFLTDKGNKWARCTTCNVRTDRAAAYTPRRNVICTHCGTTERLEDRASGGTWRWEVVLVERAAGDRRELAIPTEHEIAISAESAWVPMRDLGAIPAGQETNVLLRHGFRRWNDLYPARQRYIVEQMLGLVAEATDVVPVKAALESAIIGSCEMAGHLSRWDRWYLKSYESMAGHRFNFTTLSAEPNVWGAAYAGRGTVSRRLRQLERAATWLETRTGRPLVVEGPVAAMSPKRRLPTAVDVRVVLGSSERTPVSSRSVDLVLTDPPYHDDVQYGELSLPLRSWAGLPTDDLAGEAVVNESTGRNSAHGEYSQLLTRIFGEAARTLRPDGHLIFSYANRAPVAWADLLGALQDAGLRAVGYTVVHSENETDNAKRNVRACTLDLIMDLVPAGTTAVEQWAPMLSGASDEEQFLSVVGRTFLRVGSLSPGWQEDFLDEAAATAFLSR